MLPNDLKRFFQTIVGVVLVMALATFSPENAKAEQVDLEIVLAVDASGSINRAEYALQMKGYADAFREPSIHAAIRSGSHGKVAVALMLWSDAAFPKHATEWYVLATPRSAENFARVLETFQGHSGRDRGIGGGGTGIGDGVRFALEMLRKNAFEGARKVIDVSGDGIETDPWFRNAIVLPAARALASAQNVNINGLAILTDFPNLDTWYRENVISGPGSFVIAAASFEDFATSIRQKMLREFNPPVALNHPRQHQAALSSRRPFEKLPRCLPCTPACKCHKF